MGTYWLNNDGSNSRSFLYDNGVMTELGTLPGYDRSIANAINDSGQIVGYIYNMSSGVSHAVLWNPVTVVPEPISSILFVTGGATLAIRQYRKRKFS